MATASVYSNGSWQTGQAQSLDAEQTAGVVMVKIVGEKVSVRLPGELVPTIHASSDAGWWPLAGSVVGERQISGSFRLNLINKPVVTIDRTTGDIDIKGPRGLGFHGSCAPVDLSQRRF